MIKDLNFSGLFVIYNCEAMKLSVKYTSYEQRY